MLFLPYYLPSFPLLSYICIISIFQSSSTHLHPLQLHSIVHSISSPSFIISSSYLTPHCQTPSSYEFHSNFPTSPSPFLLYNTSFYPLLYQNHHPSYNVLNILHPLFFHPSSSSPRPSHSHVHLCQHRAIRIFNDKKTNAPVGFTLGSIEGRVAIQYIAPSTTKDNFTFKCHRNTINNGTVQEIYAVCTGHVTIDAGRILVDISMAT